MTRRSQFSKRMLAGLVGIGAAATLVACNQPTDTAGTDSTTVSPMHRSRKSLLLLKIPLPKARQRQVVRLQN
ncbi:MAG: hypothetical protein HC881_14665 [Leptolyngbyaceae cyanobacterium SL_7_1]|nr:hypothetical protein [Leptolyngbyaceae cyanobacterium SL_7_1]